MVSYRSSTISSKLVKTKWLLDGGAIQSYVPKTVAFNYSNLKAMFALYPTVYFKPINGSGGFNIVRIKKLGNSYQMQHDSAKSNYLSFDVLYAKLSKRAKQRPYLLQKGINLATASGRPFDIRVMVQKANTGAWKSTGVFTKIGRPGKVATNYNQGGTIGYFPQTMLKAGFSKETIQKKDQELRRLGEAVGRKFDRHSSGFRELGLDVALDGSGRAWILEVNTRPQFYPLKNMVDKSLYQRIISYSRQYGRTK
ncbi:YheC/YheD family protein [Paenibacillus herberti]|uniref:YheC/YheD family protein n=1 Tax=Paenibacillus herberti TaxID=1619309 RepID=UPI001FE544F2|nr:YheC/YheD family protein [Paenibacillus herberti]